MFLFSTTQSSTGSVQKGSSNSCFFLSLESSAELLTGIHFENFFRVVMHRAEIIASDKSQGRATDLSS